MSTIARRVAATPARSSTEAWTVIANLLSDDGSAGRAELLSVAGIAASLIADECFQEGPAVVSGSGPQVRVYCVYDEDAVEGSGVKEDALPFVAATGDWSMSLPCSSEDLEWVNESLRKKSERITARDRSNDRALNRENSAGISAVEIDVEGFLNA